MNIVIQSTFYRILSDSISGARSFTTEDQNQARERFPVLFRCVFEDFDILINKGFSERYKADRYVPTVQFGVCNPDSHPRRRTERGCENGRRKSL